MEPNPAFYDAMVYYTNNFYIPIIFDTKDPSTSNSKGVYATGVLFNFEDKYFIVTVAHAISPLLEKPDFYSDKIGIPISLDGSSSINFGKCRFIFPKDKHISNNYDLGVIHLSDKHVSELSKSFSFLSYENIEYKPKTNIFLITGFPTEYSPYSETDKKLVGKPLRLLSEITLPDNKEQLSEYNFFLKYSNTLFDLENNFTSHISSLGGLSGSPVWQYTNNTNGIWTAKDNLKISGIECGVATTSSWIKAVKIGYLEQLFSPIDPQISKKLHDLN